jgi:hypothetical protein
VTGNTLTASSVDTSKFRGEIRIRSLLPPQAYALSREMLALVPLQILRAHCSESLQKIEAYNDNGTPCFILGPARMGSDGKYHALPEYDLAEAERITHFYAQDQSTRARKQQELDQRLTAQSQAAQARAQQSLEAASKRSQAVHAASPLTRLEKELTELRQEVTELRQEILAIRQRGTNP